MCRRCSGMFDCNVHGCKGRTFVLAGAPRYSSGGWEVLQGSTRAESSQPGAAIDPTDGTPKRSPSVPVTRESGCTHEWPQ